MKRLAALLIVFICLALALPAGAGNRIKYSGVSRSASGSALTSATVSVYLGGTSTPANVYTASTGGASVTSVTSDSGGRWTFYVDTDDYGYVQTFKIVATKDGYTTVSEDNLHNVAFPPDAAGYLYSDGAGGYSWVSAIGDVTAAGDNTFTGTNTFKGSVIFQKADGTTLIAIPTSAPTIDGQLLLGTTTGPTSWLSSVSGCIVGGSTGGAIECKLPADTWIDLQDSMIDGTVYDEQLVCWESTAGSKKFKSCGAKITDNSTASHAIYKDSSGYVADQVLTIDAHAASTTITLIPGICPIIHNASQADENVNNTLPAVGAGKCFVALATSAKTDKYWRLTAAAANTVCLNRTCGKDYIQFDTPAVGDTFTCMSDGTNWYCYDRDSDATVGDL